MYLADSLAERKGKTVASLMERAGFAVATEVFKRLPKQKVKVLCGLGNNGGDGLVAARILKSFGYAVEVYLLGDKNSLKDAAQINADLLSYYKIEIKELTLEALKDANQNTIIIDALFGAGLSKP